MRLNKIVWEVRTERGRGVLMATCKTKRIAESTARKLGRGDTPYGVVRITLGQALTRHPAESVKAALKLVREVAS